MKKKEISIKQRKKMVHFLDIEIALMNANVNYVQDRKQNKILLTILSD